MRLHCSLAFSYFAAEDNISAYYYLLLNTPAVTSVCPCTDTGDGRNRTDTAENSTDTTGNGTNTTGNVTGTGVLEVSDQFAKIFQKTVID